MLKKTITFIVIILALSLLVTAALADGGTAVVPLNPSHVGATNPGFTTSTCPTPPAGQEGWWSWHFIMPANNNFTALSVTFQYSGTFSADPFPGSVFVADPDNSHAYIWTPGPDRLLSGTASSDGSNTFFNLSHVCNGTSEWQDLEVTKTAETTFDRTYDWSIVKNADQTELTLSPGQSFDVNYDVAVDVAGYEDSNWAVSGVITIDNPNNPGSVQIASVSDVVSPDIAASVDCGVEFPYLIGPLGTLECSYSTALPDGTERLNTATAATVPDEVLDAIDGGEGTADVIFGDPSNEIDTCVDVSDSLYPLNEGNLGTVCADAAPKTFDYSYTVGPYEVCGDYTVSNTASFTTNDTGTTGESTKDVAVSVPCAGGCSLTQGYWKTHSEFGPAPYDDTWAQLANGASTPFFLSGQTYYQVLWTPPAGNAYYVLADQYIAAQLNFLNGADSSAAQAAFDSATTLLNTYTPAQVALLRGGAKLAWTAPAATLNDYNNGLIGPGHCSE